jgi:hypothetical protein
MGVKISSKRRQLWLESMAALSDCACEDSPRGTFLHRVALITFYFGLPHGDYRGIYTVTLYLDLEIAIILGELGTIAFRTVLHQN